MSSFLKYGGLFAVAMAVVIGCGGEVPGEDLSPADKLEDAAPSPLDLGELVQSLGSEVYTIVPSHSGKCVDVDGMSTSNGARLIQSACWGGTNQSFLIQPMGDNTYSIMALHSGMCLDVWGESRDNGVQIRQHPCHGGSNQRFYLQRWNGGYRFIAKHSIKCLDVNGGSHDNGASIIQPGCHGGLNQTFHLQ